MQLTYRLAAIVLVVGASGLPAHAASSTSSAASDGVSASVGSLSGSVEQSSASSAGDKKVAEGDYRIIDVTAAAADRPGQVRLRLQALAADRGAKGGAEGEFFLYVPQATLDTSGLAQGSTVTARHKPYGVEFAGGPARQAFFLALADDWLKELQTTAVAL
ncbi:MAG: hypothetical protein AD742_18780 [Methylibium sp. NZG]|nr:MAG: hypothetical protein AD742_18780 [Methylibium sp. NZG]